MDGVRQGAGEARELVIGLRSDAGVDPALATSPEQYVMLLRRVRDQSGLSYRAIARRARVHGSVLPASTLATMLSRATLPRRELVTALLTACEVPIDRQAAWLTQWHRLAGGQTIPPQTFTHDPGLIASAAAWPVADVAPARAVSVPRQLPARPVLFAGRDTEFRHLTDLLDSSGTVVISAITGTGGVGKTWLALRWAHENLDRFPDGQLHIGLRGFDPSARPMRPTEAVQTFLQALGVSPAAIPVGLDAQVGLYRSLVAGKRMLIVLDNARDAEQVRPLLPGSAECMVIITSRHQLTSLVATDGAHPLTLDLLSPTDAHRLLARRLGEDRVTAEPAAAADIISRCARLPLALALVAARAAIHPRRRLAALADELRDGYHRLDALAGDRATDMRAVLSWSYQALTTDAARLFRLLGLHPGPDISVPAAASLAGVPVRQARELLAELTCAHLTAEHLPSRYTLHDLLRAYATEQTHAHDSHEQRRAAIARTLDHYVHTANTASLLLGPHRDPITLAPPTPGVTPEPLTDHDEALDWFTREHPATVAAIHTAGDAGFETHTWQLADALGRFFNRRGHWHDWHSSAQAALYATQRVHDHRGQASAHCSLAELYAWIGRHDDTNIHLDHARQLYDQMADTAGLAYIHLCRGWIHEPQHRYREALHDAQQALHLYTAAGHLLGQANALNNIGWYHAQLGNYQQAIAYCEQALTKQQQLGNRSWEARTWDSLGYAHHHLSQYQQATTCYQHALRLFRDLGNRYYEAKVLNRLGDTQHATGKPHAAHDTWQLAWGILHQLDHPDAPTIRTKLTRHHEPERFTRDEQPRTGANTWSIAGTPFHRSWPDPGR
ncbi:ATP-binding protein [Phytohabitans kaempferiae]|uniref:Tetratricopeptide repeat protein n=1 Tax=Phytohabitans kaempferiae TaxID=1620943 RepID=A0ABV6M9C6_9ACTN